MEKLTGKTVQFNAQRINKGNPVIGKVVRDDEEWIEIELNHFVQGMANYWVKGENKSFRKLLINGEIKIIS